MAGAGAKLFVSGDVLTANQVNTYLMDQTIMTFASTSARDAAFGGAGEPTLAEGMFAYTTDTNTLWFYTGSAWQNVLGSNIGEISTSNRNKIINGNFQIWQRGTSFSNPAAYDYTADRWIIEHDGTGATRTISQQTFTPGAAPVSGYESQYFLRYAVSVAGSGNTYQFVGQRIEDVRTLAGQTVTISFWAKADTTRTITVGCDQNFGSGGSAAAVGFSGTANVTTSWQRFTVSGSLPSLSGKTIGTSSFVALYFKAPALSTCTIDYWGVQLEAGAVATPFEFEDHGVTLAKCQRYFYNVAVSSGGSDRVIGFGSYTAAGTFRVVLHFPVTMRAEGSISASSLTNAFYTLAPNLDYFNSVTLSSHMTNRLGGVTGALVQNSADVSGTAGDAGPVWVSTDATISYSAEL